MNKLAKKIKAWYEKGNWTLAQVKSTLQKGKIAQEEYEWIVGSSVNDEGEEVPDNER